jgi:flagellar secretion chaperone FliS
MTPPTATPQAYRENAVLSATPVQLVVMLYDGARRFLRLAGAAMRDGEIERAHTTLRRAELILLHLDGVIDDEQGEPIAGQLHPIYRFCLAHLHRARHDLDAGKLEEVSDMLGELRESWAEIAHGSA